MPNTRRRRFSVQNQIAGRQPNKTPNNTSSPTSQEQEQPTAVNAVADQKPSKCKNRFQANNSKNLSNLEIVTECDSSESLPAVKEGTEIKPNSLSLIEKVDKESPKLSGPDEESSTNLEVKKTEDVKQTNRERTPRRDKYPRQHRIKVRSPKRRTPILDQGKSSDVLNTYNNKDNNKDSIDIDNDTNNDKANNNKTQNSATAPINWEEELENFRPVASSVANTQDEERPSNHSLDDMCRICHGGDTFYPENGRLISACLCRGTVGRVHVKCLERWLTESGKSRCELCGTRYVTRRVHRYGVFRAMVMWILSQNAKQLMVDGLGIMLMSPLAVLAAWLTGRTLTGLMTQESHLTPWPLASTFVLACLTLVCYYCWIMLAATRHALGWWIWYRSQYEVRLQVQENEDE